MPTRYSLIQTEVYIHFACSKAYQFTDPEKGHSSSRPHRLFPYVPFTIIPIFFLIFQITALQIVSPPNYVFPFCTIQVVRFEVFTAVRMMMILFICALAPCRLVGRWQCFGETYCLHIVFSPEDEWQYVSPNRWHLSTSLHGAKTQKNNIIAIQVVYTRS
jgi:hypothetical protein